MSSFPSLPSGEERAVIQTSDHRFVLNDVGVLVYPAASEEEMEHLSPAEASAFQFAELLPLVDYVQTHREEWAHAQARLEQTWRTVADELLDTFEAQAPGSVHEVTGDAILHLLQTLGPLTWNRALPTNSVAGRWYQSLWLPEETATFSQQWVPFLRAFHQRRLERFPEPSFPEEDAEDGASAAGGDR